MKILRLRLLNLNSLRGAVAIDFTLPPLAACGLFAITGPTGAGKTTLLDAITLALYGRVARYGPTPSPDAMMSRHTGECSAEVEFACAAGTFRSTWQLQRARKKPDGKLQPAKRRVIALPAETILAESIKDADTHILALTGLDYDRFLRSVLLAQGDFAAFLRAGPKERTDLLQQVTGTGIYQDISQAAFRRAADAETAHANLLRDHQAVPVFSVDDLARHETDLAAQLRQADALTAQLHTLAQRLADVTRWTEIETAARQLIADEATHAAAALAAAADLDRLARHEQAAPFIADLTTLDRLAATLAHDRAALLALEAQRPALARSADDSAAFAQQTQTALAAAETHHAEQALLWNEVAQLDQAVSVARETLRAATVAHAAQQKNLAALAASLATARRDAAQLADTHTAAANWLREHALDAQIAAQLPALQTAATRLAAHEAAIAAALRALDAHRATATQLETTRLALAEKIPPLQTTLTTRNEATAAARLALATASQNTPPADLETLRDRARERRLALERLAADATRLRTLAAELDAQRRELAANANALLAAATEEQQAQQRTTATARLLAAHRQTLQLAEKIQSLASHRAALQPDTPCPLCGALHHPYTAGTPDADLVALREQAAAADTEHDLARRQHTAAAQRRAALLADEQRLAAALQKLSTSHATASAAWTTAAATCAYPGDALDAPALATAVQLALADETTRSTQLAAVRTAEQQLQRAEAAARAAQADFDTRQNELARQSALASQHATQLPALETALADHRRLADDERAALRRLGSPFSATPATAADAASAAAFVEALRLRADALDARRAQEQKLAADLATRRATADTLAQQHDTAAATLAAAQQHVDAARADLAAREQIRREKFGDRSVDHARREADTALKTARTHAESARLAAEQHRHALAAAVSETQRLTTTLATAENEHRSIDSRLRPAAAAAGFSDLAALRAALLSATITDPLRARRRQLDEQRVTLATRRTALATQRAALPATAADDAAQADTLRAAHTARDAERAETQSKIGELRAALKNDAEQRERQAAFAARIDAAHRDYVRWDRLRALIGSADGTLFARFAQGLTLERLTLLANRQLAQLNPRYSLRRPAGDTTELELEIVDHYQAGVARPVRSLSGGESFLVSLALALGLSELASGRNSIESLFIDEGFGTLDADTLETAMAALENLQAAGKTIGVISHVPAMQERIAAQIRIAKASGGCSTVAVSA